jgi:hypothetical protein
MWTIILAAINFLSSNAFTAIANGVVGVLNKRTDAKIAQLSANKETDIAAIEGGVAVLQVQAANNAQRWGWWGTRYMALAASLGPIIHANAIYLDSTFRFGWAVAKAPGAYEGLEIEIILGCVGILTAQHIFARRS